MTITPQRQTMWWSFIRSSPFTNMFYPLILTIHKPKRIHLYFLICYIIVFITNGIEKGISKLIYNILGIKTLPFIGSGDRPKGASNCGTYLVYPDKPANSYGMPSGHSELGWFFSTYIILDLISKKSLGKYSKLVTFICIIILIAYAIVNSYARVEIEKCHTTGQTLVGAILGIIKGFIFQIVGKNII
jgi:membrane-associated phospholipid phosphatase